MPPRTCLLALPFLSHSVRLFSLPSSLLAHSHFINPPFFFLRLADPHPPLTLLVSSLLSLTPSVLSSSCLFSSLRVTLCLPGRSVRSAKVRQLKWQQIETDWENNRVNWGRACNRAGRNWQQNALIVSCVTGIALYCLIALLWNTNKLFE